MSVVIIHYLKKIAQFYSTT